MQTLGRQRGARVEGGREGGSGRGKRVGSGGQWWVGMWEGRCLCTGSGCLGERVRVGRMGGQQTPAQGRSGEAWQARAGGAGEPAKGKQQANSRGQTRA